MKIETLKGRGDQCDQIGLLETIFLRKLAQIFHNFWGDLKNITVTRFGQCLEAQLNIWPNFESILAHFYLLQMAKFWKISLAI